MGSQLCKNECLSPSIIQVKNACHLKDDMHF